MSLTSLWYEHYFFPETYVRTKKRFFIHFQPPDDIHYIFEFIIPGVLLNIVGFLGLLGNILSIIVLSRPQMKSSIHCLLLGLASYDSVLIVTRYILFCHFFCFQSKLKFKLMHLAAS